MLLMLFGLVSAEGAERPNIIFMFTDDHAYQAISAYDSSVNRTPNIDRIAAEGMIFRNSFVTNSFCGPSRAVILTGKHQESGYVTDVITEKSLKRKLAALKATYRVGQSSGHPPNQSPSTLRNATK